MINDDKTKVISLGITSCNWNANRTCRQVPVCGLYNMVMQTFWKRHTDISKIRLQKALIWPLATYASES